jgi:beta-carotene 3-hydroxylase
MFGLMYKNYVMASVGFGILLYGICYVIVHEIFIHQRIKRFTRTNNPYFKAIRFAHKIHHKHNQKENGECFGMLFVPMYYYKKALKENVK